MRRHTPSSRVRGFVLVATLWILAALALAAGYFALWVEGSLKQTALRHGESLALADLRSTEAVLKYRLVQGGADVRGYPLLAPGQAVPEFLRVDGTVYRGMGKVRFQLQDLGGLVNLNTAPAPRMHRIFDLLSVPQERRAALLDALADYTDSDNLSRLNGAEAQDYERAKRPVPPNYLLRAPGEARAVLGWEEALGEGDNWVRLLTWTTARNESGLNINAAPREVLITIPGIGRDEADAILRARAQLPFLGPQDLAQRSGVLATLYLDDMSYGYSPTDFVRIALWVEGSSSARSLDLWLSPLADQPGPWAPDLALEIVLPDDIATREPLRIEAPVFERPGDPATRQPAGPR